MIDILNALDIDLNDKDRIIFGGPLTGLAIYSPDYPVEPDTDAIIVQDSDNIIPYSDYPCINCGECIRICPTKVPVNMVVRFLEEFHHTFHAEGTHLSQSRHTGCGKRGQFVRFRIILLE